MVHNTGRYLTNFVPFENFFHSTRSVYDHRVRRPRERCRMSVYNRTCILAVKQSCKNSREPANRTLLLSGVDHFTLLCPRLDGGHYFS
ncbi:hypothetical protein ATCV1_z402R [Acanthocystis turfacea chlorella virus 1]|uniref:Uncharacterized protein z402R n=1 Tax=Chlorovirus heliozoae TaxID=322019 RepID=A7K912_9PHYC|nr:hypothetical protein ATCV1_z402R [Acanthocystis turfacea chlorella virus 1]ABT16536.1 hypothetical protein ATCV1_z402R [Acanthocystis turfacea chlorella virus 1]